MLQKAIANGLVPPDAQLSDGEIDNLLFLPGFSTASAVSNISGRGVGMDVVKRSIQALGGRISISSSPGQGSTFTLSLPLTLAVLDGIVVTVDAQVFVIPLTAIVETVKHEPSRIHHMGEYSHVLRVRDVLVAGLPVHMGTGCPRCHGKARDRAPKLAISGAIVRMGPSPGHRRRQRAFGHCRCSSRRCRPRSHVRRTAR